MPNKRIGQALLHHFILSPFQLNFKYLTKTSHSFHKICYRHCQAGNNISNFREFSNVLGIRRKELANKSVSQCHRYNSTTSDWESGINTSRHTGAVTKLTENFAGGGNKMGGCDDHLYPSVQPYNSGLLEVSSVHKIYYEECGNKDGVPILYVHGGPGGGCGERDRRFFDPEAYRIVLFDQRGAGKSTPAFSLEENDTWNLVADIEKLRKHLGIEKWVVFGGSWGSTLALVYAETHIDRVLALVLRGIFTLRKEELAWFYQEGASYLFPDFWEEYVAPIPEEERGDFISAYYKRLTGDNEEERLRCARAWSKWEMATSQLLVNPENLNRCGDDTFSLAFARIECHYFINNGFFKSPNHVLDNAKIIHDSGIPVTIVQGRYDVVCPAKTAWELHKQLPNADFHIVHDAGHSAKEDGITKRLVEACDKYRKL